MSQERVDNLFASESWTAVYTAFTNVSLKAYDFDTIRAALIDYVSITYPDKFNDFIASSEFVAVLDLVAYLGHSLSFRLDMNTRENFLDTAERRESVLRMAKTLGYNKTRPTNARGFLKITSVTTNQPIADNEGNSLANRVINWNDSNNADWYENFIDVVNASLSVSSKIQDPMASMETAGVENYLYEINQTPTSRAVSFAFDAPISGASRRFEAVRTEFKDDKITEAEPIETKKFTIVNRNDNLGPASDRTGFFVYAKTGTLNVENFSYNTKVSNLVETITATDISNTDVWVQRVDTTNTYASSVAKVDNDTRETAIYNSLRNGNGDIVSVNTITDNAIELHYGDGVFSNAASGNYRVWYRKADNENYRIDRNDVKEKTISIPYVGADNKNYRLVFTLSSTRDFSENFAAESYTSVRRIAPRSYYAQDRMVNAQDYNVLPLSLGSNIVSKVKAINTTYAGNSRYFEMDDVTGHHSNISITGTDGSVYMDSDVIAMTLRFNRQNGNAVDFVRNEITKAIRHPSLINLFYSANKTNTDAVIELAIPESFTINASDPLVITADTTMLTGVWAGDFIKILGASGTEYWTQVHYGENAPVSNVTFEVTDIIPETSGEILTIVRGYRTRFTDTEITTIRTDKIEDLAVSSFIIKYVYDIAETKWVWQIHDGLTTLVPGQDVFLTLSYNPGIRETEAEYKVAFTGTRIVFSSKDQVKFYYGNEEMVVDNETNLAERDKLLINYYDVATDGVPIDTTEEDSVILGFAPIDADTYVENAGSATFNALFKNTGAYKNLEFINDHPGQLLHKTTQHYLVSPLGVEYPVTPEVDVNGDVPIIGESPNYTLSFDIADTSNFIGTSDEIELDAVVDISDKTAISNLYVNVLTTDVANVANSASSTATLSSNDLNENGFKGSPSLNYFSDASDTANFVWIDENELPTGETAETATSEMEGVQLEYFTTTISDAQFEFEFPRISVDWEINLSDTDVKWKQFAYSKIVFNNPTPLSDNLTLIREQSGAFISNEHWELTVDGTEHTITFWTYDPQVGSLLDVLLGDGTVADLSLFSVKVEAIVDVTYRTTNTIQTYRDVSSYVYDKFITSAGYTDSTKVKLLHMDSSSDPFGIIDVVQGPEATSSIILESYKIDDIAYERVSSTAIAAPDSENIPDTAIIWYDTTAFQWKRKISGVWTTSFVFTELSNTGHISYNTIEYRVVNGRSYVEDPFMSFRWDHYADKDKRIDPSTSNIIDMYVLTEDYVRNVDEWIANGFGVVIPSSPNNFELRKIMEPIEDKAAIGDHVSYIPVKFKMLFGEYAEAENQAIFKVIPKKGTAYTDSEIKSSVAKKINEYFKLENWDFGDQFYFSELASYLHQELADYISSVIITPKFASNDFKNLLSISCEQHEVFLSVVTSKDVKIISSISDNELTGE